MCYATKESSHIPFRRGDPERKRKIQELLDAGMGPTEIAKTVGALRRQYVNLEMPKK
jgi:hypothetical protein